MRIVVTGGAGFIGKYVVRQLLAKNHVKVYDNFSNSKKKEFKKFFKDKVEYVDADILDYKKLVSETKNADVVIHMAAKISVSESMINPGIVNDVNVTGTINVLRACVKNKIKKVIYTSSAAIYGNTKRLPINEDDRKEPTSPYGASKISGEYYVKAFANAFDINCCSLRIFNVFGKGQRDEYSGVISKFYDNIIKENPIVIFGDGKQTRDFIAVNDVAIAFEKAIKNIDGLRGESFNIASGKSVSINELAKIMLKISNKNLGVKHTKSRNGDIKFSQADITKAKKYLGFKATTSFKDGLMETFSS